MANLLLAFIVGFFFEKENFDVSSLYADYLMNEVLCRSTRRDGSFRYVFFSVICVCVFFLFVFFFFC